MSVSRACACFFVAISGFSIGGVQADTSSYRTTSNVLAIGLPAAAALLSVANDDAVGLWQLTKSEVFTVLTTELLKNSFHETRPNGRDDKSFPSGHTAVAFAAAQYMQMRGGWEYGLPAYALASAVAYSRVEANEHYWKDVAAGAALGIASSYFFTDKREQGGFSMIFGPRSGLVQYRTNW